MKFPALSIVGHRKHLHNMMVNGFDLNDHLFSTLLTRSSTNIFSHSTHPDDYIWLFWERNEHDMNQTVRIYTPIDHLWAIMTQFPSEPGLIPGKAFWRIV